MDTPKEFLRLENITKTFGGVRALRGVSLSLRRGEIYHLMGENGSGKSTIIKIISGAQPPDSGQIFVEGQAFSQLKALDSIRVGIETVYQDLSLFSNLSVAENVALCSQILHHKGQLMRGMSVEQMYKTAEKALERVGLPTDRAFLHCKIGTLPIAVRQLVAIARGIATHASLVIMDEPTTALTQKEVDNLIGIVESLRLEGVSVLFVSHKLDEVFRIGGNVIVFRDGQKVADGHLSQYSKEDIAFLMTGKRISNERYRQAEPQNEALLEVKDLSLRGAFNNVSFTLRRGEVLGITGLLDSGRNELALALAGIKPVSSGEIRLEQQTLSLSSPREAMRVGIGYVPEDRLTEGLFLPQPIRENIIVTILDKVLRGAVLDRKKIGEFAQQQVERLQIATPNVELPVQSLSGGNQQRVMVARWLAIAPKVLLLHGPTMGVDVGSKAALYNIIQDLAKQGMGIVMISDDLPELLQNTDRILVMNQGALTRELHVPHTDEATLTQALFAEHRHAMPRNDYGTRQQNAY